MLVCVCEAGCVHGRDRKKRRERGRVATHVIKFYSRSLQFFFHLSVCPYELSYTDLSPSSTLVSPAICIAGKSSFLLKIVAVISMRKLSSSAEKSVKMM